MIDEKDLIHDSDVSRFDVVLICIHDRVAKTFTMPYYFVNEKCAGRYYMDLVKNNSNKRDYSLVYLGKYNYAKASFDLIEPRVVIQGDNIIDFDFKAGDL